MSAAQLVDDPDLYRSILIVPGGNAEICRKAYASDADIRMLDLDDGVVPDTQHKQAARETITAITAELGTNRVIIRINGVDTDWWRDDLRCAHAAGVATVIISKVSSAAQIREVVDFLRTEELTGVTTLWPMIESPDGVLDSQAIAAADPRVRALLFGFADFAVTSGGRIIDDPQHLAYPFLHVLCAARAAGLLAFAPAVPFSDMRDLGVVSSQARSLRNWGYDGAMVVSPRHLGPVHDEFSPSEQEIAWARRVVEALQIAQDTGSAAVAVDGRLVELVNVKIAQRSLRLAELIAQASTSSM